MIAADINHPWPQPPSTPLLAERSLPPEILRLCERHRNNTQCLAACSAVRLPHLLEFATFCTTTQRDALSTTLVGALSAALPSASTDPARAISLFAATLSAARTPASAMAALPVLHTAAAQLLAARAEDTSAGPSGPVVSVCGSGAETAIASFLDVLATSKSSSHVADAVMSK